MATGQFQNFLPENIISSKTRFKVNQALKSSKKRRTGGTHAGFYY
jgi:hypothetical protein